MKKNLLTVLILALLVVNIALTAVMMISVMGTNKKTADLVTNIATVMNLELTIPGEEEAKEPVSLADTEVYNLTGSMTIPLAKEEGTDKQGYIVFDVALSINKKHKDYKKYGGDEKLAERESLIKDAINSTVSRHTESECEDFNTLRDEILKAVQDLYGSDFVYNVAISGVKFS